MALRNAGPTEIAGFGVTLGEDPFKIDEFHLVKHEATASYVEFDDGDMADFQGKMFAQGIYPDQCRRIWIHTHPGDSAEPSGTDWTNFAEHFENQDWQVMLILARGGNTKAILRVRTVPSAHEGSNQAPIAVDKELTVFVTGVSSMDDLGPEELAKLPLAEWLAEYKDKWRAKTWATNKVTGNGANHNHQGDFYTSNGGTSYLEGIEEGRFKPRREVFRDLLKFYGNRPRVMAENFLDNAGGYICHPDPKDSGARFRAIDTEAGLEALKAWVVEARAESLTDDMELCRMEIEEQLGDAGIFDRLLRGNVDTDVPWTSVFGVATGAVLSLTSAVARFKLTPPEEAKLRTLSSENIVRALKALNMAAFVHLFSNNNEVERRAKEWFIRWQEQDAKDAKRATNLLTDDRNTPTDQELEELKREIELEAAEDALDSAERAAASDTKHLDDMGPASNGQAVTDGASPHYKGAYYPGEED